MVANRGEVWRDQGGEAAGITGVAWDVTDRKRAEEALRLSEERYRELFENASDIVYTTDLDGRMTSMNRVGSSSSGIREEIAQLDLWQLVAPQHWERLRSAARDCLRANLTSRIEVESPPRRAAA